MEAYSLVDPTTGVITSHIGKWPPASRLNCSTRFHLPCGKCIGCKLEYSRVWAVRCTHEASLYKNNCFITLTYDDIHLPWNRSLVKADFQLFMKRLRKKFSGLQAVKRYSRFSASEEYIRPIRYYMCGEYGEKNFRPHYHALLFNYDFPDKVLFKHRGKYDVYTSEILSDLWGLGFASVGEVNFDSASYVARYACKSSDSFEKRHWLNSIHACDLATRREVSVCIPQYTDMSRAWGIGRGWYDKFGFSDVYAFDHLIVNGHETRPPRYYDNQFAAQCGDQALFDIKAARVLKALEFADNNTPDRLIVRERCTRAKLKQLQRSLDYDA